MITRIALFIGTVRPGAEDQMRRHVEDELAPLWRQFDGAAVVRVLWNVKGDPNGQTIPLALQVDYDTRDDIDRAMASPARYESRDMLPGFYDVYWDQVRLEHHEFEVD